MSSAPAFTPTPPRRARRLVDESRLGGVAAGLAEHLGLPVLWVRVGLIVSCAFAGFGALLYAGLWLVLPAERHFASEAPGLEAATRQGKRRSGRGGSLTDMGPTVALGAIGLGIVTWFAAMTGSLLVVWPAVLLIAGVAVLWRQADEAQRERWRDSTGRISVRRAVFGDGGWAAYLRVLTALGLLLAAVTLFALRTGSLSAALNVGAAAALCIVGITFMVGPWLIRLASDLNEERTERVRTQERADVAAHLHDSVLQTLALIQKSAADPAAVGKLARSQERDLRSWLYDEAPGASDTIAPALRRVAAEIEDATAVPVEVVCVGDGPVDAALIAAAREAILNAAKHGGAPRVDVYAEVDGAGTSVFVRDRGVGFDPEKIGEDRHGLRDSVRARMERHGGSAEIITSPGSGTEVRLRLPAKETS